MTSVQPVSGSDSTSGSSHVAASSSSHVAGTGNVSLLSTVLHDHWVVDSGASTHVCYMQDFFTSVMPASGITLSLSNQTHVAIEFIGDIHVTSELVLKDVLFVSSFCYNLLSVSALNKGLSFSVLFADTYCVIHNKSSLKMIGIADLW